jgi:hypothetical protein
MLLAGDSIIAIDNCEKPLGGELLCQMLTQPFVRTRILGRSETPELSTAVFIAATGNNLVLAGDLTRRALLCRVDPKMERPETRVFHREPVAHAKAERAVYVCAVLTILRAYHVAGRPAQPTPLGSFEAWSGLIRGALLWLGAADPVATMEELRKADPQREDMRSLMAQWNAAIGPDKVTVADVVKLATERKDTFGGGEFVRPAFREALLAVAGRDGNINSKSLGKWLSAKKDRVLDGSRFEHHGERDSVALWALRKT